MEKIITPKSTFSNASNLWRHRELFFHLIWRDLTVRYKQTVIGISWVILQPVLSMIVFNLIFGNFSEFSDSAVPYPVFVFTGLIFWNFFTRSITQATESLASNRSLISKISFPRLLLPFTAIAVNMIDFLIAFLVLLILMFYFQVIPQFLGIIVVFFGLIIISILSLGLSAILSPLNFRYHDIMYLLPYAFHIGIFLTPVIYPVSFPNNNYRFILRLNPLTAIIESVRSSLFDNRILEGFSLVYPFVFSITVFIIGINYFLKSEKYLGDI